MTQISLDSLSEEIHNSQTKEYFKEILSSYYNGLYRATVVMLYTVTISDLYLKLIELHEKYSDTNAENIIEEIKKEQNNNIKGSDWENNIVQKIYDKTKLISADTLENIFYLKKKRHLCAHPVIINDEKLYSPDRELTRSLIQQMLIEVFTISPLDRVNTFEIILNDIKSKQGFLPIKELRIHLKKNFINKISNTNKLLILKKFWSITFNCTSNDCNKNRDYNLIFIDTLLNGNLNNLKKFFLTENILISKIQPQTYFYLIRLLNRNLNLYPLFNNHFQIFFEAEIKKNINLITLGLFKINNFSETTVTEYLTKNIVENSFSQLIDTENQIITIETIQELGYVLNFYNYVSISKKIKLEYFGCSKWFDDADIRFSRLINEDLISYDKNDFKILLDKINSNYQIHARKRAKIDNRIIKKQLDIVIEDFDYSEYPNFNV